MPHDTSVSAEPFLPHAGRHDLHEPGPQAGALARLAALAADETRAACLLALLDGRAWTAGELARHCGVAASTLSEHLGKLVGGGLLTEERQGRHRYVRLADARVAQLVEDLTAHIAPDAADGRAGCGSRARTPRWRAAAPATTISPGGSGSPSRTP
ncbi:hypothetical protein SALBM217S_03200 [Streptomyces griseoloalbus]